MLNGSSWKSLTAKSSSMWTVTMPNAAACCACANLELSIEMLQDGATGSKSHEPHAEMTSCHVFETSA